MNSPFHDVGLSELDDLDNDTDIDDVEVDDVNIREYGTDSGPADNISEDELDISNNASSAEMDLPYS